MIPPVGDMRPFLVNPYNLPNVKQNEPLTAQSENVIRNFITENGRASSTNGIFPTSVIGVFRALEIEADKIVAIRQFNSAGPFDDPEFEDTGEEISNIYDNEQAVEEGEIFIARWDSSDGVWYAVGGCESSESEESEESEPSEDSSSTCNLKPCCNYWGVITEISEYGDAVRVKVYDHDGNFICEVEDMLDWVECELMEEDIVAVDTDIDAFPKILIDACLALKRACDKSE